MTRPRTTVVTGSASGIGAATRVRLEAEGQRVVGVDLHGAEVEADLGTPAGRAAALDAVAEACGGVLDGLVTCAGLAGLTDRPGGLLVAVNHFGTVELLSGLRPLLAAGDRPAAVAISSNSTTIQPRPPLEVTEACLAGDEDAARAAGDAAGSFSTYAATKLAVARWVRRNAPTDAWAGAGIALNAVSPGAVVTPLLEATRQDPTVGDLVDALPMPVGRLGQPDDVAAAVTFLLGPEARFCCGTVLVVDGGTDALLRPDAHPAPWTDA